MKRVLTAIVFCLLGLGAWSLYAHPWGWLYAFGVHPYPASSSTPWTYQMWSGIIPALTILTLFGSLGGAYHLRNCKATGCWRLGHYLDSRSVRWCWKHHPDHGGKKPTTELLHQLHREQVSKTS